MIRSSSPPQASDRLRRALVFEYVRDNSPQFTRRMAAIRLIVVDDKDEVNREIANADKLVIFQKCRAVPCLNYAPHPARPSFRATLFLARCCLRPAARPTQPPREKPELAAPQAAPVNAQAAKNATRSR